LALSGAVTSVIQLPLVPWEEILQHSDLLVSIAGSYLVVKHYMTHSQYYLKENCWLPIVLAYTIC